MNSKVTAFALAAFFVVVQFYTSLAALSPTPPVGFVFATAPVAAAMVTVLALAALVAGAALVRARGPLAEPSRTLLCAWLGAVLVATVLGLDPLSGLQVFGVMLLGAAFHLALVRFYPDGDTARTVIIAYLGAGAAALAAGLVMFVIRRPAELAILNNGRAAGVFVTANQCAAFALSYGFAALGVALGATGIARRLALAGLALAGLTLVATLSLGGLLGAAAGGVFFAAASGARRSAALAGLATLACAGVLLARPLAGHDPSGTFDRLRTWHAGARAAELFALTGAGPMAYWRVYPAIRPPNGDLPGTFGALHPHNAYLSLLGELGTLGTAAVAFGWLLAGRAIARGLRERTRRDRRYVLALCAGLVAVLTQGLFDTIGVVQLTFVWIPYLALVLAAARSGLASAA